ncbi:NAD(P)H-flavin reductase [Larsenimonas salina]|uniref:NAD(P)H-flavin reductase n=1 Tax=Larsenimonas salina TaxID=1295565 RepID=UPI0020740F53|nr:NAD(P)H-flavin reductase [Larsenimonas salina]MCM5704136.1 NAD(P)H-flavin reductase [Larsenimonas salina]
MSPTVVTCQVEAVETLSEVVYRVFLKGESAAVAHAPGQYLELEQEGDWLPFSIANHHQGDGELELHIQYAPENPRSKRLFERLFAHEAFQVRLPSGESVLDLDDDRPLMLIAAGTGFAQMKAIIEAALAHHPDRPVHLWWAGKTREDLYLESLPRRWSTEYPNVTFTPVIEAPSETDFDGMIERVDRALHARVTSTREASIFISGSPGMVYAVVDTLDAIEPLTERVFSDVFSYAPRG